MIVGPYHDAPHVPMLRDYAVAHFVGGPFDGKNMYIGCLAIRLSLRTGYGAMAEYHGNGDGTYSFVGETMQMMEQP